MHEVPILMGIGKPVPAPDPEVQLTEAISRGDFRRKAARSVLVDAVSTLRWAAVGCVLLALYVSVGSVAWVAFADSHHPLWLALAVFLTAFGVALGFVAAKSYKSYRERIGMGR